MWTVRTLTISAKRDMDKRKTSTNSAVHAYKVVKKTDEYYFKSAINSSRCICAKLCGGKYRKIILLKPSSLVPNTPKNLFVVLVGLVGEECFNNRRSFQSR